GNPGGRPERDPCQICGRTNHIAKYCYHRYTDSFEVGARYNRTRRTVEHQWEFQRYNWPQGTWGGPSRLKLENASPEEREALLQAWGGTTTAKRNDWRAIIREGLAEGWYQQSFGAVEQVKRNQDGKLETVIGSSIAPLELRLRTDFIIDATGLVSTAADHPLLNDMIDQYNLDINIRRHLDVNPSFEIEGMRNGSGRMYAAGVTTLFGYAPVDTFLGLNYSAQRSVENLAKQKTPHLKRLSPLRSLGQWLRWTTGATP
ncbi:MAG: hypothetical protein AAF485_04995, partial [Chloroflexota bacterium]